MNRREVAEMQHVLRDPSSGSEAAQRGFLSTAESCPGSLRQAADFDDCAGCFDVSDSLHQSASAGDPLSEPAVPLYASTSFSTTP